MYYLAWKMLNESVTEHSTGESVVCYAESKDGLHWEKPSLGICEYNGSTDNNIILDAQNCDQRGMPYVFSTSKRWKSTLLLRHGGMFTLLCTVRIILCTPVNCLGIRCQELHLSTAAYPVWRAGKSLWRYCCAMPICFPFDLNSGEHEAA